MVVPDLGERLPGRGAWVTADASALAQVVRKNLFSRAFKAQAKVPPDLPSQIEQGLARRLVDAIAMARKAGLVTMGFDAVKARLKAGSVAALIEAADGAEGGKGKLRPLAGDAVLIDTPTAAELGLAFGREFVIHAVLDSGGAAERAVREHRRLSGFRSAQDIRAA
jgi:ribosomal protein L30E